MPHVQVNRRAMHYVSIAATGGTVSVANLQFRLQLEQLELVVLEDFVAVEDDVGHLGVVLEAVGLDETHVCVELVECVVVARLESGNT